MYKIIVADDDVQVLAALKTRLEAEGLEVHAAQDGYFALQLARDHDADVMVLDINMPAGDGFSVQERIRKIPALADTPVIYITGDHSLRVSGAAAKLGAFALIHKPFESKELIEVIRDALESRPLPSEPWS